MAIKHPSAQPDSYGSTPLPVGAKVGRYEVLSLLGGGGMGLVYRALDTSLQREVAIKVLHEKETVPGMRERLIREARAVSAINHPSICTLYDIGEQQGDPYLVMELLQGETLRDRMRRKPLSAQEIVEFSLQIADALAEAHKNNIIHRDIKPANIFLCSKATGAVQVKVLDFGLAKRNIDGADTDSLNLTGPGTTIGTISYMSPEQARGEPLDGRTDLFSFGTVMYEMATNTVPFVGQTSAMVFVELLEHDPKPVRDLNRTIPLQLINIINKALYKEPGARYQSAFEIHTDLEAVWSEIWSSGSTRAYQAPDPAPVPPQTPIPAVSASASGPISRPMSEQVPPQAPPPQPLPPALPAFPMDSKPSQAVVPAASASSADIKQAAKSDVYPLPLPPTISVPPSNQTPTAPPPSSAPAPYAQTPPARSTSSPHDLPRRQQRVSETTGKVRAQSSEKLRAAEAAKRKDRSRLRLLYFLGFIVIAIIAASIYLQFVRSTGDVSLHQTDTIAIGKVDNKTDSSLLDHSFRDGLYLALSQSPFINTILAPDNASSFKNARGILVGSVSGTGPYVVDLRIVPTSGGKALAEVQDTAQDLDNVLATIDRVSLELRRQAGESAPSMEDFFHALHQEATPSLAALDLFAQGDEVVASHGPNATAEADYLQALDIDKYFTLAWERLALLYAADGKMDLAVQDANNAYSGRQSLGEHNRMLIEIIHAVIVEKDPADAQHWLKQLHTAFSQDTSLDSLVSSMKH